MAATVDWGSLTVAGSFVLGAVLATVAMLRVVRAVTAMFSEQRKRPPFRGPRDDDWRDP